MTHDAASTFGIDVGDDPIDRLAHVHGFFLRNPGYITPSRLHYVVRRAAPRVPVLGRIGGLFISTEIGFGQPIVDQMLWQQRTGRRPTSDWWSAVNRVLVTDPLVAERAVRDGREDELVTGSERDWARYLHVADVVRSELGIEHFEPLNDGKPVALCDAWRSASVRRRIRAGRRIDQARRAYWTAHEASVVRGRELASHLLVVERDRDPIEARFAHGWAGFIGRWGKLSPPATGRHALLVQDVFLPGNYEQPDYSFHATRCMFAAMLDVLDPDFEDAVGRSPDDDGRSSA